MVCVLALGRVLASDRAALVDKFELRTGMAATLIAAYLDNQKQLGRARAEDLLSTPEVTPAQLQVVVSGLGYAAGGLFDGGGRLIVGLPYDPARVGQDFTARLEHVRVAVTEHRSALSQVVVSPALDKPAVGIGVPFTTPSGNRIFTGVFTVQEGTLTALTRQAVGLETGAIHLLDRESNLVASSRQLAPTITPLAQLEPVLAQSVARDSIGTYEDDTASYVFASNPVPGTDWRIVTVMPTDMLFKPSQSGARAARVVLFVLATAGLLAATLLGLAMRRRQNAEDETCKLNAALEARVAALAAANQELETFSYSVSHDLRAPLRAIQGFSTILVEEHGGHLNPEGARLLGVVSRNAAKMGQLIEDILAFSRIGRRDFDHAPIDMNALVEDVVTELRGAEPGRDVSVTVARLERAHGDRTLIRQVWANLLDNAFKFTASVPAGEVHIDSVRAGGEIVYRVRDNGAGFDSAHVDKLFGVFQRLHGPEFPGTGIGLAIVERIVTRHGGRVWAEGQLGDGASFSFTLAPCSVSGEEPTA